jgi:hypothetical protein
MVYNYISLKEFMRLIIIYFILLLIISAPVGAQDNSYLYSDYQTYKFESIEIQGPLDFINMIYQGLMTLRNKSYNHYKYVSDHTKRIIFKGTGEKVSVIAFTYINGNARGNYDIYFIAKTVNVTNPSDYGPLVGSILVHESTHLEGWDEPDSYYFQIEALRALGASNEMINYWEKEYAPILKLRRPAR